MAASIILVPSIHAFSLRLNVPVAGSYEVDDCSGCSPKSGGYSIRGIFGMFGLGYTVGTFDWGYPSTSNDTDAKLAANAVDLSASFGFFTIGVGSVISGTLEGKYGYTETETDVPATGYTRTLTSVVDAKRELDGYRRWNTKFKHKLVGTRTYTQTITPDMGFNSSTTESVNQSGDETKKMDFNQITAGIGFGF